MIAAAAATTGFFSSAQELLLVSLISTKFASPGLIRTFHGLGFSVFAMFRPVFALFPADLRGESGRNAILDHVQYHPYIFYASPFLCENRYRLDLSKRTGDREDVPSERLVPYMLLSCVHSRICDLPAAPEEIRASLRAPPSLLRHAGVLR